LQLFYCDCVHTFDQRISRTATLCMSNKSFFKSCRFCDLRSGMAGSLTVGSLQIAVRRGYSKLEGVISEPHSVTYFWSPVSNFRFRFKKQGLDAGDFFNYWPVSNLNTASKVLERLVLVRLLQLPTSILCSQLI